MCENQMTGHPFKLIIEAHFIFRYDVPHTYITINPMKHFDASIPETTDLLRNNFVRIMNSVFVDFEWMIKEIGSCGYPATWVFFNRVRS